MKVILKDNFGRESVSERVVCMCDGEGYARRIAQLLNDAESTSSSNLYQAVSDDYKLYTYDPT